MGDGDARKRETKARKRGSDEKIKRKGKGDKKRRWVSFAFYAAFNVFLPV